MIKTKYSLHNTLLSLIKLFCAPEYSQEITGDLEELFYIRSKKHSYLVNVLLLFIDIIKFFKPTFWKYNFFSLSGGIIMLTNNIKFAFRNFVKHSFNSSLNVIGLTVSIACILYISSYVYYELSFDKHIKDSNQIYRLTTDASFIGKEIKTTKSSAITGKILYDQIPEIEFFTQVSSYKTKSISYNDKIITEEKICSADSNFAKIFNLKFHYGNLSRGLVNPDEVLISQKLSTKLFGSDNPVGKKININSYKYYTIAGVFRDLPANTHIKPNLLYTRNYNPVDAWANYSTVLYLKLKSSSDYKFVQSKIDQISNIYLEKDFQRFGIDPDSFRKNGNYYNLKLQKLNDIHLHSSLADEFELNSDIKNIYIFQVIGVFILIIATINFVNLSTARATLRAKEVGIKKVLGSSKKELIVQFLFESVIISLISFILALIGFSLGFNIMNSFLGLNFENQLLVNHNLLFAVVLIIICVGFIAGIFPAFVLSSFTPINLFTVPEEEVPSYEATFKKVI